MSSTVTTSTKNYRVVLYDIAKSDAAFKWASENISVTEWDSEVFENFDCFYFTTEQICSMFIFVHGGKYIPPPRGSE